MHKLLAIKDSTNRNVGLFNMAHLLCVWENGPTYNNTFTFEFTNNRKVTVQQSDAGIILMKAGFEIITLDQNSSEKE